MAKNNINQEYINGILASIAVMDKYKDHNVALVLIIRELKEMIKNEKSKGSY